MVYHQYHNLDCCLIIICRPIKSLFANCYS